MQVCYFWQLPLALLVCLESHIESLAWPAHRALQSCAQHAAVGDCRCVACPGLDRCRSVAACCAWHRAWSCRDGFWWPLQSVSSTATANGIAVSAVWQLALVAFALAMPMAAACAGNSNEPWRSGRRVGAATGVLLLSTLGIAAISSAPTTGSV